MITTSGPSGRTQRLEAYRAGAWEFLGQPLDGEALLLKLDTFLQSKQQVDILREENLLDSGTGLYNMRGLARRAREIGADALRRREALACVVFAPEAEPETGRRGPRRGAAPDVGPGRCGASRRSGRVSDAIGRLGPPEFAVIAPATGAEGALRLVNRLGGAVEATRIPVRGGERCRAGQGRLLRRPGLRRVAGGCRGAAASCHDRPARPQARRARTSASGPSSRCPLQYPELARSPS